MMHIIMIIYVVKRTLIRFYWGLVIYAAHFLLNFAALQGHITILGILKKAQAQLIMTPLHQSIFKSRINT
ncbi:MAG: hypothetical protein A2268_01220 [Candidatus Raymondbacteria bacterium RifOxyA12_full_50_37]|uniref:Uncharacterized protein n=1 Tax=Candidatus Raymondbacteria bacterium RIFOXYD12_FULL_49_13 TaxID=1817890 RepID=A0A1F7FCS7_UNCRA|nr:MAG: hypothetical protein A2268_01220 [Candidatus Raymondbacteria bacterium RifOxyA12_full_50_37]OGJ86423.1 MAG: hypothetical protein A2248_14185 [Candidatus Raymondbacteria bacterium RIFOXYA2_FULL_49_16]OGJ87919.1 MAG: hypothetical protein A2350_15170 [Candidatus Raymondbacteria bacterium RifOxyB12_full_50_8]OGJ95593.1 MAG: hypothetical protein A2453_12960 [Candidatus Raymondbacteria bacterium RIFOXYC2_FULL_50_21]OGK04453.1 MAG: hypothetical protein A2519_11370 [Candidatus Raymondbacteria b